MIPNAREKPVRVGKVEFGGYRLPQPHELPPLQNHQNHSIDKGLRKVRLTPVQLRSMNFAEMENGKTDEKSTIVVPRLALRGPTPDPDLIQLVPTPPPSDREERIVTEEVGTQTDDNFDTDNDQIIEVLANSAIRTASAELEVELLRKELSEERRMQEERDLSRSLAIETCNEVMLSSIEHLNELQAPPDTKSVGVDTKAFTRRLRNLDLLTVELEQDFFPWLFAKADRMFSRKMTSRLLDEDAIDSDDRIGSFGRQVSNCLVLIRRDNIARSEKLSTL
ncbi:unnamed protein product [Cylicocyclus nassatus]|uniref:Uncharacterized protein n=1 Tax=Cylicocyclus nassatus TaxID=53992 RepID=A0AA36DV72_CYLNA|nr:unnamed protein product [Cylicocyclus nassatus]